MRTPIIILVAMLALATAAFSAPKDFEGKITFKMSEGKKSHPMTYFVKGTRLRIEMSGGETDESFIGIHDFEKKEMLMIMPAEKMYMVMSIDQGQIEKAAKEEDSKFEKTGRTETIAGYSCEEYVATEGKETTEFWGAVGLGMFRGIAKGEGNQKASSAWEREAERKGLFPLRVITKNAKGKETSRMEATSVEPGKLKDELFRPPDGYEKFEMPNMGNLFGR